MSFFKLSIVAYETMNEEKSELWLDSAWVKPKMARKRVDELRELKAVNPTIITLPLLDFGSRYDEIDFNLSTDEIVAIHKEKLLAMGDKKKSDKVPK